MKQHEFVKSCDETNMLGQDQCFEDFITAKMGCKVPWQGSNTSFEDCETAKDLEKYLDLRLRIHRQDFDEELEQNGCISQTLKNCKSITWPFIENAEMDVKMATQVLDIFKWTEINVSDPYVTTIGFSPKGQAELTKEYYLYVLANLVADTGGYMGLFLGASILSIFELILSVLKKMCNCKK